MKRGLFIIAICVRVLMPVSAQEQILNIYSAGFQVQQFALSNIDSIAMDDANGLMIVYNRDGTIHSISMSAVDSMNYSPGEYTLPVVETVSAVYDYSGDRAVCVVNITDDGGCGILERGICWSKEQPPTIEHNKQSSGTNKGKFFATMTDLDMGSTYYARAYASNCMGTAYGEVAEVGTRMGDVTYTLDIDQAQYPEYYSLLKTALDSACYYYSTYTLFQANIYVYYNAGIPTAQASYHTGIGFGPGTEYMWVGTVMHEMAHYFGSGTTGIWQSLMVDGVWQGTHAQDLCQELAGTTLKGDNNDNPIHFWPFGINYRSEVNSATDLVNHARIVQSMLVEDCGLPTSW